MAPKWSPAIKMEWLEAHEAGESQGDIAKRYGASKYTVCTSIARLKSGGKDETTLARRRNARNSESPGDMARTCVEVFGRVRACGMLAIRLAETREIARAANIDELVRLHLLARCVLLDVTPEELRAGYLQARAAERMRLAEYADQAGSVA